MFAWRAQSGRVALAITDRHGGTSVPPYAALNLGGRVGDDPAAVVANRAALAAEVGVPADRLLFMAQCHQADVVVVDGPWSGDEPACDALITKTPGLAVAALVADCTPVLLWDNAAGVIGAVHSGRPGLVAGIVPAALEAMRDLGAESIQAVVGPSICSRCYEVPAVMQEQVCAVAPASRAVSWTGTPALDVAAGVVEQLHGHGIPVQWLPGCARESDDLFSHRRDGVTGRYAAVVVLEE